MTNQDLHAKVNDYAAQTDFDRGDLSDDREHMAPAAFIALRYVLHACDELDRSDLMDAAVHRIRAAISTAFDHAAPAGVRRLAEEMDAEAAALATTTSVAPQPDQSINNEKGK